MEVKILGERMDKKMKKLKEKIINAKNHITKLFHKFERYIERNWENTRTPVYLLSAAVVSIFAGVELMQYFHQKLPAFLLGAVLTFAAVSLAVIIAERLIKLLLKFGIKNLICIVLIFVLVIQLCMNGSLGSETTYSIVYGVLFALALILFAKACWAIFHNKIRSVTVWVTLIVTTAVLTGGSIFIFSNGFTDDYVAAYLNLNETQQSTADPEFSEEFQAGEYTVASLEYGPEEGADIVTQTYDLSFCVSNLDGVKGIWRDIVTGYDVAEAPVAGKIWYPAEGENCPVLFIAHGNHSVLEDSYLGYEYLGEYLASHGYVVVSVDENVLNMLSGENDARAILLLENIKEVLTFNNDKENSLYKKINEDQIAIAGHSRGGEMVATAYLFNDYETYPENGMVRFNYHFNIQSIIAIAPTVDQYKPAGHEVELEDVNYLLLHGANDQDVNTFMGNVQYENIKYTGDGDYIKSSLYIAGANHGQFNSRWGTYDQSNSIAGFLNVKNLLPEEQQQIVLKIYTKVFLDKTLLGETAYEDLLTDYEKYQAYLPETVYVQQYQLSQAKILCDYEEDSDLQTATDETAALSAHGFKVWGEEMMHFSNNNRERKNHALYLKWKDTLEAYYAIDLNQELDLKGKSISFDICDRNDDEVEEEAYECLRPVIRVVDVNGNEASVDTADYVTIYQALPVKLGKTQYLASSSEYKHQFQTAAVPEEAFTAANGDIDMSQISRIEIAFPNEAEGIVNIDNICIQ